MLQNTFTWLDEHYDKIAVEEAIQGDPAVPWTILRLPMVYGPGDPLHRFFPLLKRITDGRSSILHPKISPRGGAREDMWRTLRMRLQSSQHRTRRPDVFTTFVKSQACQNSRDRRG
jgi:hypothetical protein